MSRPTLQIHWVLAVALCATGASLPAQPPVANPPRRVNVPALVVGPRAANPQLEVELSFVRKVCAPSKEQMQAIRKDLQKCLAAAADGTGPSSCDLLPQELADCVASHLSKEDAARYRAEVAKREAQEREACVYTLVALVDPDLSLSDEQRKKLVPALTRVWKPVWSQMIELNVRWNRRSVPPVPDDVILPLLDAEQAKAWKRLPKNVQAEQAFDAQRIGAIGTPNPQRDDE
jgi:hypothetical protein